MLRYSKVINEETKQCEVADYETYTEKQINYFESLGMTLQEVDKAYNEAWYLMGYVPQQPIDEQNEVIRQTRESLYVQVSDKIKADYDEAVARGSSNSEQLKKEWLASKDKIRKENPYIKE